MALPLPRGHSYHSNDTDGNGTREVMLLEAVVRRCGLVDWEAQAVQLAAAGGLPYSDALGALLLAEGDMVNAQASRKQPDARGGNWGPGACLR